MMEALTDGWTDTQNFGVYNVISLLLFVDGHNYTILYMFTAQGQGQISPKGQNFDP